MTEPTDDTLDEERIISGYVAYFEPLRPPDELIGEAGEFIEKAAAAEPRLAESLQRSALERLVDAFLVDRRGHAECFSAAHLLGREILRRFGCPFTFDAERKVWILRCGVLALHSRVGTSPGGPTIGECSICGAADFECDHINGEVYDGKRCHRVITRFDLREISLTPRPHDPRCYRLDTVISAREAERRHGGPLAPGETPICEHCATCPGAEGPTSEDLNPEAWQWPTAAESSPDGNG
jgi:hypothetical protein